MKYKIIAIMGEAGSGKDTLMRMVCDRNPYLHEVVSCTTRPPREGEQNGVNYHFLNNEEFADRIFKNEMFEATLFNGWAYGTSKDSLSLEDVNIGVFNPEGIETLLTCPDVELKIFRVMVPDNIRLIRQLSREQHPDIDEIFRRFKTDREDFFDLTLPCTFVPNETMSMLDAGVRKIEASIKTFGKDKNQ